MDDTNLKEELRACQQFLVNSELDRARHKVSNYAVESVKETIVNEKLSQFSQNMNCAGMVSLAFGFFLQKAERFRYF